MPELKILRYKGDITPGVFQQLFRVRLGSRFPRALEMYQRYGSLHAFSVANALWLACQKGTTEQILEDLEKGWQQLFSRIPDVVTRGVEIKLYFDTLYLDRFPEMLPRGVRCVTLGDKEFDPHAPRSPQLILPPNVRSVSAVL